MDEFIALIILGIAIIIMGVINTRGNIRTLKYHHRKRVSEENRVPFGRLVGLGTIICGVGLVLSGVFNIISSLAGIEIFQIISGVVLVVTLVAGVVIMIYAMIKYNGGIF